MAVKRKFWRTWFPIQTGLFIREYLLTHGEASPYDVYKELKTLLIEAGLPKRGMKWGSYQSVRNYFWWLEKLGLITPVREEPASKPFLHKKIYYKLTRKGMELPPESIEWSNPRRAAYPESWEKHH